MAVPASSAADIENQQTAQHKDVPIPFCLRATIWEAVGTAAEGFRKACLCIRSPATEKRRPRFSSQSERNIDVIEEDSSLGVSSREQPGRHHVRMDSSSSSEELVAVASPYADAIPVNLATAGNSTGIKRSPSDSDTSTESFESRTHSDVLDFIQQHYNSDNDVVLRMEFMREREMKAVLIGVWAIEVVGVFLLALGVGLKINKPQRWFFEKRAIEITNVIIGLLCFIGLSIEGFLFFRRLIVALRSGKRWSIRRKRVASKAIAEHLVTFVNVSVYFATNVYVLSGACHWFSRFVIVGGTIQWSCWNATFVLFWIQAHDSNPWIQCTGLPGYRPDNIVMDAPRIFHLPKLPIILVIQGLIIAVGTITFHSTPAGGSENVACNTLDYHCSSPKSLVIIEILIIVGFLGYFLGVIYYLHRGYESLRQKPYTSMRMANLNIRFNARLRFLAMVFFVLCLVCYIFIRWATCVSYLQTWLGFQPMLLVMTGVTAAGTYAGMPKDPATSQAILQIWLQEFSWGEDELRMRRAERMSSLPCVELQKEPMYCFETSLKMLYWSMLVYRFEEPVEPKGVTLQSAMKLYALTNFELMHEKALDTKALMAWNKDTVVLSFRGTASFKNVLADLRAWYSSHLPKRGRPLMGTRPYVHQGFLRSWEANGLKERVVSRVNQVVSDLAQSSCKNSQVRIFVTGHSLGGALATLAAIDIQTASPFREKMDISCYTFGAPRTGNHAFAKDFNEKVPNTWNIINDQDAVPRSGKFLIMYKRPGQRVLINTSGDMIVRPSFIEAAVQRKSTSSLQQHLLVSYQRAHVAIIKAQFTKKRLRDGTSGVLQIAEACGMHSLLMAAGIDTAHLRTLLRFADGVVPVSLLKPKRHSGISRLASRRTSSLKKEHAHFKVEFDLPRVAAALGRLNSDGEDLAGKPLAAAVMHPDAEIAVDDAPPVETAEQRRGDRSEQDQMEPRQGAEPHQQQQSPQPQLESQHSTLPQQSLLPPRHHQQHHDRQQHHQQQQSPLQQQQQEPSSPQHLPSLPFQQHQEDLGQHHSQIPGDDLHDRPHIAIDVDPGPPDEDLDPAAEGDAAADTLQPHSSAMDAGSNSSPSAVNTDALQAAANTILDNANEPLQTYAGRLMERSGTEKYARYTHFNGVRCPWGGRVVEQETGKCESNFCRTTNQARDDLVDGDDGQYCRLSDRPAGIIEKSRAAAAEAARRMMGR